MMLPRGLGYTAVVQGGCPAGQMQQVLSSTTGAATVVCTPLTENIWCKWFGWDCMTPAVAAAQVASPAAPQTQVQMTDPLAWTPDTSAAQTAANVNAAVAQYYQANPGVATVPSVIYAAAEAAQQAAVDAAKGLVSSPWTWVAVAGGGVLGIWLLGKMASGRR